ncbi:MAG: hypothetical protein ACRD6W_14515, partial [Nitrososphaerales archaeon]
MSERRGLDERLRTALGGDRPIALQGGGSEATRSLLLARIRQRRARRLQAAGVASVLALGLALG